MAIDTCVQNFPAPSRRLWRHLLPNVARVPTHGQRYRLAFRKNRLRRQWQVTRDPTLETEVNRLQRW
jgi:hypothetical protein